MKRLLIALTLLICLSVTLAVKAPEIPKNLKGYTKFTLAQVKKNSIVLNTYLAHSSTLIIKLINEKKVPPASYSVFLRAAFRKLVDKKYEIIYYFRTYDPRNKEGKIYYGTFTSSVLATGGERKFLGYEITHSLPRN